MKYLVFSLLFVVITSCNYDYRNSISGNGKVMTQEVKTGTFDNLSVSDALDVVIIPSDTQKVVIVADENIVGVIDIKVRDNNLQITTNRRIWMARSKKVEVYTKELEKIEASAASTIKNTDSLLIDHLKIVASSAAQLEISGRFNDIKVEASSASNIKLYGQSVKLQANLSSAAGLNALGITVEKVSVWASSAANAKVYVTREAEFDASSAASIIYQGNPVVKNINTSSGGSVNK
jgi:hypothetical protein